jgi:hypothetical protein
MRYRRRLHIPYFYGSRQVGHLDWRDGVMEAYTADGNLVGKYPTRREAAAALWAAIRNTVRDVDGRWHTGTQPSRVR